MNQPSLTVIGGGIVGMSTALFSARSGYHVTLFEKHRLGNGATKASAGALIPPTPFSGTAQEENLSPTERLSRAGYQFYDTLLSILEENSLFETGFTTCGTWHLAITESERKELRTRYEQLSGTRWNVEWNSGQALREQYAGLSEEVKGGYVRSEEAQVDPGRLTQALRDVLISLPVTIHENEEITDLQLDETGRCTTIESGQESYRTENVVLAAGCWTGMFDHILDIPLPVKPVKGQMIKISKHVPGESMLEWKDTYLIPRMDGTVDIGATIEDQGFDQSTTPEARNQIFDNARRLFPDLSSKKIVDQWTGLRPCLNKTRAPLIGPVPRTENLYLNVGHCRKGILQGPISGKLLAQMIAGEEPELDPSPFLMTDPSRTLNE